MERYQVLLDEAGRRITIADHMLSTTYPLVKDPKLLLAVLENVFKSMDAAMSGALAYERTIKRIPLYPDNFEARFTMYKKYLADKHETPAETLRAMHELKETIQEHDKSPIEFRRHEKFVICTDTYKIHTITPEALKIHVKIAKEFTARIRKVTP